jgi:hypothetical protein
MAQIFVKTWKNETLHIPIEDGTTVKHVRDFIFEKYSLYKSVEIVLTSVKQSGGLEEEEAPAVILEEGDFQNNTLEQYGLSTESIIYASRKEVRLLLCLLLPRRYIPTNFYFPFHFITHRKKSKRFVTAWANMITLILSWRISTN